MVGRRGVATATALAANLAAWCGGSGAMAQEQALPLCGGAVVAQRHGRPRHRCQHVRARQRPRDPPHRDRSPPARRRAAPGRHRRHGRPRGPDRRQRRGAARCATARRCSPKARCSRRGFARVADRVGNRACAGELLRREDAAWQAKLGLWADPYYEVLAAAASTDVLARGEAGSRWRRAKWSPYAKAGPTYT